MNINKFIATTITCLVINNSIAATNSSPPNQCTIFDHIALQLALAQNKMQSPINLEQLKLSLGPENSETSSSVTTYSWNYKNRVLLVKVIDDNITTTVLTGNHDGSMTSKKMEQIYEKLKLATSIWTVKKIQNHLGPGYIRSNKLQRYKWDCGIGSLEITADQNNNISAAAISYRSSQESIEAKLGSNHPEWDSKTDSLGTSYRVWQRSFAE